MEAKIPKLFLIKDFDIAKTWSPADKERFKDGLEGHLAEQINLAATWALVQISTNYKTTAVPSVSKIGLTGELGLLAAEYDERLGWNILCYLIPGTQLQLVINYETYKVIFEYDYSNQEQLQHLAFGSAPVLPV